MPDNKPDSSLRAKYNVQVPLTGRESGNVLAVFSPTAARKETPAVTHTYMHFHILPGPMSNTNALN